MPTCAIDLMLLWQLAISGQMVGLETCGALMILMLVVNIQTRGAPISYASIPGSLSASASVVLIVTLGIVANRWGKTKLAKTKIICLTTSIELLGVLFVFLANGYELLKERNRHALIPEYSFDTNYTLTHLAISKDLNNASSLGSITLTSFPLLSSHGVRNTADASYNLSDLGTATRSSLEGEDIAGKILRDDEAVPWNAYLVMAGYTLMDCGYDSTTCFLKMFVLDCTPPDFHAGVLIKLVLLASVGGVLTTALGSSNLTKTLTLGTVFDPNASMCCILAAISFILVVAGTGTSVFTGLIWRPPRQSQSAGLHQEQRPDIVRSDEKTPLKREGTSKCKGESHQATHIALPTPSKIPEKNGDISDINLSLPHKHTLSQNGNHSDWSEPTEKERGCKKFIQRHKTLILINISAFLLNSSYFTFQEYSANFLGQAVFDGDPSAPLHSSKYLTYLQGVSVGSQGILISYITCTIANIFHENILSWLGWKLEVFIVSLVHCAICLVLGLTLKVWVYYLSAAWFGVFRAISLSVPYILANKTSLKQDGIRQCGHSITSVSAMLPLSILVCSPLVGPLIDVTGDAATSVYYACVCALLGCLTIVFIKI